MSWRLAVDFDATLVERGEPLRWRAGAKEALFALAQAGNRLIIHSARATPPEPGEQEEAERANFYARGEVSALWLDHWERLREMREFLRAEGVLGFVEVWQSPGKPHVDRFLDDLAEKPDWRRIRAEFGVG